MRWAIFLCLTGVFMLVGSRERPWGDAGLMYEVAHHIVHEGNVAVSTEWPPMSHRGRDGKVYAQYALGPSVVSIPGVLLRARLDRGRSEAGPLVLAVTSHVAPAMLAAFAAATFFALARRRVSARRATMGTVVLALATIVFVYARSPFSEMLQTACALGFVAALDDLFVEVTPRRALAAGAWAGALLNAKTIFVLSIAGAAMAFAVMQRRDRRALIRAGAYAGLAFTPFVLVALGYNYLRWGSLWDTGYGASLDLMREHPAAGLFGLLLSPGKSVFLYSPPLLLGVLALPRFFREHRQLAWLSTAVVLPPLLFYSRFLSWAGDYAWGPRYLVFAVPLLWLPAVVSSELATRSRRALAVGLVAAGVTVQILGASFYWDHWIRIAIHAREAWLGKPDRSSSLPPLNGAGLCDACFEDMHGHQWLPPLSPIAGHAWLLRHRDGDWGAAERDAPWRRYTSVSMPRVETYFRAARFDWWGVMWLHETPGARWMGGNLALLFVGMAGFGAARWRRALREDVTLPV